MRHALLSLSLSLAFLCTPFSAGAADPGVGEWTTFGNGPSHSGSYPKTIGSGTFTAGWTKTFATVVNQAAVSGTTVYLTTNGYFSGGMRAFALSTIDGQERWSYPLANAFSVNPPTFWNGRVYFQRGNHSGDTHLWCLNASTGTLLWAAPHQAQWERYLAPAVVDEGAFVNGGSYGGLYGFNSTTGAERFFVNRAQQDGWTPSYAGGAVYSCVSGSFLATSASTGSQLWIADLTTLTTGTDPYWSGGSVPAISGNFAVVNGGGRMVAMNLTTHLPAWSKPGAYSGTPAIAGTKVYVISGGTVQAFNIANGTPAGTYTAGGTLTGQPIVTNDRLIVSSDTNTYIFDLATSQLKQTLPSGGYLSYAAATLYVVGSNGSQSTLATYQVTPSELDPPLSTVTSPPGGAPQPRPNPARTLGATSASWLDCQRFGSIAYFLFDAPAKLERYNLFTSTWLSPISLPDGPKAFAVGDAGIFVSFGRNISKFSLDGTTETPLATTVDDERHLIEISGKLYLADSSGSKFIVMNETTGATIQAISFFTSSAGFSASATKKKLFARSTGISPSDIEQYTLNADGTMSTQSDSPYHGSYPNAQRTYLFPGEGRVVDNSGIIYSTGDLSYLGSLAGAFDDLDFAGDAPVVLRGSQLVAYSNGFLETGRTTLSATPSRILVTGSNVASFRFTAGRGVSEALTPLAQIVPATPGTGVDPNGLSYVPDVIEQGNGGIIYILHKATQSIFRWSLSMRKYLATIPLADVPQLMAYSSSNNRLYLSYSGGRITKVDLDSGVAESAFANTPLSPQGLAAAGNYLFAEDASGAWATHYVFSSTGQLTASKEWNYYSREYVWNATNRKMYFLRDDTSPNDLIWEDIDLDGKIGSMFDSPYHGEYSVQHPLRVSPDGTEVVLGNGDRYTGIALTRVGTLGIFITDAAWTQSKLFTLEGTNSSGNSNEWPYLPNYTAGAIRAWDANRQPIGSVATSGKPLKMFAVSDGLITVSQAGSRPRFTKHGFDLALVSSDPQVSLPTIVTTAATLVTTASAQLNGEITGNDYTDAHFDYGTTTNYGSRVDATIQTVNGKQLATASITSLKVSTTYHFRLVASGPSGPINGATLTFKTAANAAVAMTGVASGVTPNKAQLNGIVTRGSGYTQVRFDWGTTTDYGQSANAALTSFSNSFDSLAAPIANLTPETLYHFRIVAILPSGEVFGSDATFVTEAVPRDLIYFLFDSVPRRVDLDLLAGFDPNIASFDIISLPSLGDVFRTASGQIYYLPRIAFRNYSGSDSFTYLVNDGSGGTFTRRVTFFNPFFQARGTFSGTIFQGNLNATVTPNGRVTGSVRVNGATYRFTGNFDNTAQFAAVLTNPGTGDVPINLNLIYEDGQFRLAGTVLGSPFILAQTVSPAAVSRHEGTYNLIIPPDPDNHSNRIPQGSGYAVMTISSGGAAKVVGQLADGKPFSGGGPVFASPSGDSVTFSSLLSYSNIGTFSGKLVFSNQQWNDCSGSFVWQKPGQRSGLYSAGFQTTTAVEGSRYAEPGPNVSPIVFAIAAPNARFLAGQGNLVDDVHVDLTITRQNVVLGLPADSSLNRLKLSPSGMLTGSFIHPADGKPVAFRGIVSPKVGAAFGYFLGQTESGWVALTQ